MSYHSSNPSDPDVPRQRFLPHGPADPSEEPGTWNRRQPSLPAVRQLIDGAPAMERLAGRGSHERA